MEVRDQLQTGLAKLDADGIVNILDKINPKILGDHKELKTELYLLKLYKMIRDKGDPAAILEFASQSITAEIKNSVEL